MGRPIGTWVGAPVLVLIAIGAGLLVRLMTSVSLHPVLSDALAIAAGVYVLYILDDLAGGPLRRLARPALDQVDYRYQRTRAAAEIRRRIAAIDEEQRVRALTLAAKVHENAARAVSDGKLQLELEELKGRAEQVVMRSQSVELARALARYQAALWQVKKARHMTAGEKARLLAEMRSILAAEDGSPLPGPLPSPPFDAEELSWSAQPAVVLEYRAPGGAAIPVTVRGFRKLIERGQLEDEDECRRLGSLEWIPVAQMRATLSARAPRALDP